MASIANIRSGEAAAPQTLPKKREREESPLSADSGQSREQRVAKAARILDFNTAARKKEAQGKKETDFVFQMVGNIYDTVNKVLSQNNYQNERLDPFEFTERLVQSFEETASAESQVLTPSNARLTAKIRLRSILNETSEASNYHPLFVEDAFIQMLRSANNISCFYKKLDAWRRVAQELAKYDPKAANAVFEEIFTLLNKLIGEQLFTHRDAHMDPFWNIFSIEDLSSLCSSQACCDPKQALKSVMGLLLADNDKDVLRCSIAKVVALKDLDWAIAIADSLEEISLRDDVFLEIVRIHAINHLDESSKVLERICESDKKAKGLCLIAQAIHTAGGDAEQTQHSFQLALNAAKSVHAFEHKSHVYCDLAQMQQAYNHELADQLFAEATRFAHFEYDANKKATCLSRIALAQAQTNLEQASAVARQIHAPLSRTKVFCELAKMKEATLELKEKLLLEAQMNINAIDGEYPFEKVRGLMLLLKAHAYAFPETSDQVHLEALHMTAAKPRGEVLNKCLQDILKNMSLIYAERGLPADDILDAIQYFSRQVCSEDNILKDVRFRDEVLFEIAKVQAVKNPLEAPKTVECMKDGMKKIQALCELAHAFSSEDKPQTQTILRKALDLIIIHSDHLNQNKQVNALLKIMQTYT